MKTFIACLLVALFTASCSTPSTPSPAPLPIMPPVPKSANVVKLVITPQQFPTAPDSYQWLEFNLSNQPVPYTLLGTTTLVNPVWTAVTNSSLKVLDIPFNRSAPNTFYKTATTNILHSAQVLWDASPDTNVVGYNVYYGIASGVYTQKINAGTNLTLVISNLVAGTTYYIAATAYDAIGDESAFSNEIGYTPSTLPPWLCIGLWPKAPQVVMLGVTNVTSTTATLEGQITSMGRDTNCAAYFQFGTTDPYTDSNAVFSGIILAGNSTNLASATLTNLAPSTTYYAAFYALNATGTGSSPTDATFTTLPAPALRKKVALLAPPRIHSADDYAIQR